MTRLLASGVDSLYWSARADVGGFASLRSARDTAAQAGEPTPWASIDGFTLSALPHGVRSYPVVLACDEFRIHVTDSRAMPTLWVQLASSYLQTVGAREALAGSVRVAGTVVRASLGEPHPSRVDLFADFAGWKLVHDDRRGIVTHAKLHTHSRAGTDELETIQVGKSPLLVRLYRKDIEVRQRGGHAPVFWGAWDGPVTRVEVQISSERLSDFHFASCDELLASTGDLWRYATSEFMQLREPGSGPRETWRMRDEWALVQGTAITEFPHSGVVPDVRVNGDRVRHLRAIRGYLTSLAAIDGADDLAEVLRALPAGIESVARGRHFSADSATKRARLPKAWRVRPIERSTVSGGRSGAGKERECEPRCDGET